MDDRLSNNLDYLGFGLGLRTQHYDYILEHKPKIDWFEVLSENYMVAGGNPIHYLEQFRALYPLVLHGVSLSIGSADPLNMDYLAKLKQLASIVEPRWISDHLCWTGTKGYNTHDLLPLPYTQEAIQHVVARVKQVQDYLGRQILLENVSSYVTYRDSQIQEWEFLTAVAERADCLILLDINNIYVSAYNHGFDPKAYLTGVPKERVQQFHLAGHLNLNDHIIDTHDHPIITEVWDLYAEALKIFGRVSTMIERDAHIPEFTELATELDHAKQIASKILQEEAA